MTLAHMAHGLDTPPQTGGGFLHRLHQRPGRLDREVETRAADRTPVRVVEIIQNIDAAAERDPAIDDTQLAVQASPTASAATFGNFSKNSFSSMMPPS